MINEINFNDDARTKLLKGANTLADAVSSTLGPKGRNVIIEQSYKSPHITKDGVTVAKSISLEDPTENLGAQILKQAAAKTVQECGDGTTTSTVLAQAFLNEGHKLVQAGANPIDLKRGMDLALKQVTKELEKITTKIEPDDFTTIADIASVSANGDEELGQLIATTMKEIGVDGVIAVEESKSSETYTKTTNGYEYDRGYLSPYFINEHSKHQCILKNSLILLYDKKIRTQEDLKEIVEYAYKNDKPLLIIAEEIEASALQFLVMNRLKVQLKVAATKAPGFGDRRTKLLEDIAAITGATLISETKGLTLADVVPEHLGTAKTIKITKNGTTIIDGEADDKAVDSRIESIRAELDQAESDYDKDSTKRRLAQLTGGVATIYVGATTEVELKEKKDRLEDAIHATSAARLEGILPGGGHSYLQVRPTLQKGRGGILDANLQGDIGLGIQIIYEGLKAPYYKILENAGEDPGIVYGATPEGLGYNASNSTYEDLISTGIIDPAKVTRVALENAVSVASMLLMTEVTLVNKVSEDAYPPAVGPQPMM